jgi:hypothetical protein
MNSVTGCRLSGKQAGDTVTVCLQERIGAPPRG